MLLPNHFAGTLTAHARASQARPDVGGERIPLSKQQFSDLITVHLADWLEQVRPMPRPVSLLTLYMGKCKRCAQQPDLLNSGIDVGGSCRFMCIGEAVRDLIIVYTASKCAERVAMLYSLLSVSRARQSHFSWQFAHAFF